MVTIKPFKGIMYNPKFIQNAAQVLTPPYDIIDSVLQNELYAQHDNNFVRIDFGRTYDTDTSTDNVYTRSNNYFQDWKKKQILCRDQENSFYLLKQTFKVKIGNTVKVLSRSGFFGLFKVSDFSTDTIMPHERTQSGPKENRYLLTKTCGAYFSAVFTVYKDPSMTVENLLTAKSLEPVFSYTDYQGADNALYRCSEPTVISAIASVMRDKPLLIADGHHRYETALRISKEFKKGIETPTDYALVYFSNTHDPGLMILPTHRLVKGAVVDEKRFKDKLKKYFIINEMPHTSITQAMGAIDEGKDINSLAVILKNEILVIKPSSIQNLSTFFPADMPDTLKKIDVNIIHYVILRGLLEITEEDLIKQTKIAYTKDETDALNRIKTGRSDVAILLNPTPIADVMQSVDMHQTMPQKSTYFYPKIPSGAVIYDFNDNR